MLGFGAALKLLLLPQELLPAATTREEIVALFIFASGLKNHRDQY